ncbi:MAG TPA: O-antigen ligase family protein, partial [Promineifilum sp.]|nr:O-antigen ligase family protein [Promineifilum sp.]
MDSRLSRWCAGLLEAGWLIAILAVPLFFNIQSERVFEPDKLALLRSLVLVMAAIWLVGFIDRRGWLDRGWLRPSNPDALWHRPLVLPVLAVVVIYVLASLFSVSPRVSWLGSYQRLQGTYTTLAYIAVFALMAATIRTPEQVRRAVTVAIVTSIPVALYGLLQHFGQDPLPWGGDVEARVAGHMGNAIFIAAYLIMIVPLTLGRAMDALNGILSEERLAAADVARASAYLFTLAIQLLTIYWSGSRGPLIGLGVGLFAFTLVLLVSMRGAATEGRRGRDALAAVAFALPAVLALLLSPLVARAAGPAVAFGFFFGVVALSIMAVFVLAALRRGRRWLWLAWMLLTIFMASWLLLFNVPAERTAGLRGVPVAGSVLNVFDEWRALPTVGSFGRMLDPTDTTGREKSGRVRILIWQGVVKLISFHTPLQFPDGHVDPFNWLRPILGYGPETMYVAYNRFYPPELATVEARNASPDRSHNETFDALVITGLLGLVAWQALFLSVILFAFRALGVVGSRRDGWMLVGLWVGGAVAAALLAMFLVGPIYLGVAVPVGVILGVVAYLIYQALFGRTEPPEASDSAHSFASDRLLMNALVAAVLAHYVEIHFGIAISATRLHFFVYAALMLALVSVRARPAAAPVQATAAAAPSGKRRRKAAATSADAAARPALWSKLLVPALLLTLMVGILGYNFITYALPPGKTITGPADLSAVEVFRQSLTQNARADFAGSPFVLSLLVLSW